MQSNWDRIFNKPMECPRCKEIELRKAGDMFECRNCGHLEQ